jgi:arylsulfatase A-like enzyme
VYFFMAKPNVLCLSIDRLQAGMLGPYGNTWLRTPEFDRLAARSFVFDQAYTCQPDTDAVLSAWWPQQLFGGHALSLITDDPAVYASSHAKGFAEKKLVELPATERKLAKRVEATQLASLFFAAIDHLGKEDSQSRGLWIHTRGMAGPWDAPAELRNQFADEEDPVPPSFTAPPNEQLSKDHDPDELLGITHAYAGQISLLDTLIGVLLNAFEESPAAANTMLLIVGMRGFPLGEHLRVGECDAALYNELTHVPLFVRLPTGRGALARSSQLMMQQDVPRLISDWIEAASEDGKDDSCLSLIEHGELRWRDHLRLQSKHDRAIRTPAWYLRESEVAGETKRELYVKPDDRWEVNDVADRLPEITAQLSDLLGQPASEVSEPLPEALLTSFD